MDLELTDDQLAMQQEVRRVLATACPPALVRATYEGSDDEARSRLWPTLVALDWPGVGVAEEHGGVGLGPVEVAIVVEELGRVTAPTPFLATATQLVPAVVEAGATTRLADVAAGRCTGTLALAEHGRWELDAVATTARPIGAGWVLDGVKTHVVDGATADELAVVARVPGSVGPEGIGCFLVPGDAVKVRTGELLDATLPVGEVALTGVEVTGERVLLAPGDPGAAAAVERAVEAATVALAVSTVATCRAIFEMTLQYAKDRHQFGRPIGSFQALKHRLADAYLAVERAGALAWYAVLTIAEDDERRAVAASMAKAAAGDCQRLLVREGLQLHGGVGFTWEHDLHFLLKRAKVGDLLFGGAATHRARLARLLGVGAA